MVKRKSLSTIYAGCGQPIYYAISWKRGAVYKEAEVRQAKVPLCGTLYRGTKDRHETTWSRRRIILCERCFKKAGFTW